MKAKILLAIWGVLTVVPVFILVYLIYSINQWLEIDPDSSQKVVLFYFNLMLGLTGALLVLLLQTSYVIFLFKKSELSQEKKIYWSKVILLGSFVSMPYFWYRYIWLNKKSIDS